MNKWIAKSIEIFNSDGYLDELFEVYPININFDRDFKLGFKTRAEIAFSDKNEKDLIKELLNLSKFPINDPYIASLRKCPELLDKNPETKQRIGQRLFSMGLDNIFEMVSQPKSSSRQFGNSFQKWLPSLDIPFLLPEDIVKKEGVFFLKGSNAQLKKFAKNILKIKNLDRCPDFILKKKDKFMLGEAKFLTSDGGTQNNQFDNALKTAKIKTKDCTGIAIVDGVLWIGGNEYMQRTIRKFKHNAFSALLLKNFIKEF
jgi:hypothetical protein